MRKSNNNTYKLVIPSNMAYDYLTFNLHYLRLSTADVHIYAHMGAI